LWHYVIQITHAVLLLPADVTAVLFQHRR